MRAVALLVASSIVCGCSESAGVPTPKDTGTVFDEASVDDASADADTSAVGTETTETGSVDDIGDTAADACSPVTGTFDVATEAMARIICEHETTSCIVCVQSTAPDGTPTRWMSLNLPTTCPCPPPK
jgi:hypothetical protein